MQWAVDRLIQRRSDYGIPPTLPLYRAFTNFDNTIRYPTCDIYRHVDHRQVHEAFFDTSYPYQFGRFAAHYGRGCDADVDTTTRLDYPDTLRDYLFEVGAGSDPARIGPWQRRYGWLVGSWLRRESWDPLVGADPKYSNQQHFWIRRP